MSATKNSKAVCKEIINLLLQKQSKYHSYCFTILATSFIAAAILLQNRSFLIGYVIAAIVVYICSRKPKLTKAHLVVTLVTCILFCAGLATFFKTDSSAGRLLVYKISLRILRDNFMQGIGWGKFAVVYGNYQTEYFRTGKYTTKEFLLADNTKHAFNDYLQFIIENGAIGIIIIVVVTVLITLLIKKTVTSRSYTNILLPLSLLQTISISIAAVFTHVFEKAWVQLLFIISLTMLIHFSSFNPIKKTAIRCLLLALPAILWAHYGYHLKNYSHYKTLFHVRQSFQSGYLIEAKAGYQSLYPQLKEDDIFLYEYAKVLIALDDKGKAEKLMQKVVRLNNTNFFYLELARCYASNRKNVLAEEAFLNSIYRVPNRFIPRYDLFNFYIENNQPTKARVVGKQILKMPVKVPSKQIEYIKKNVGKSLMLLKTKKLIG